MVEIRDVPLGRVVSFPPLPPYTTPEEILANTLPVLDPPSRLSVTEAAERYVRIQVQGAWQSFDRSVTPYMVEPTDMTQSRLFTAVAFMGPSQSGKTKMLETVAFHAVTCNWDDVLVVHMTRSDRDKWVEQKLDPSILNSPVVRDLLGRSRDDSTFSRKRFRGMRLTIGYPTATVLSGGTYRMVLLTDLDHMPLVLGGADNPEGSPFRMSLQRIKTFFSRGCVLAESSPAYPVLDLSWAPTRETPHELPPVAGGIAALYNQGTRGRWYWECPDCGDEFEPRFEYLNYDESRPPGEAGRTAELACPHCGSLMSHRHKMALNRAALKGRGGWRHEGRDGTLHSIGDDAVRDTRIASFALNGVAATFANWADLVTNYEEARRRAETLGDDSDLASVTYTEIGMPYRRLRLGEGDEVTVQFLRDHAQEADKGVAPDWARFITISVDVQATYFPVQVTAWGQDGRCQVVDRFDLTQPPDAAPHAAPDGEGHQRRLDPARYIEDWQVLEALADKVVPVAGQDHGLRPIGVVVDFQGKAGVSDNAEAFLKKRRRAGQGAKWFLSRGQGGWRVPFRVRYEAPERASKGKKGRAIKLLTMATDRLKDTVHAAMGKAAGGAGAMYLPQWMSDEEQLGEFVAEERGAKGWEKKKGQVRNEGLDLSVQARAVAEHCGMLRVDWDNPPAWCVSGSANINAVSLQANSQDGDAKGEGHRARAPKRVHTMSYLRRG